MLATAPDTGVLLECALAIVGVYELDERTRHQFLACVAQRAFSGWIEPLEVSVEVEKAEHVDRGVEETILHRHLALDRFFFAWSRVPVPLSAANCGKAPQTRTTPPVFLSIYPLDKLWHGIRFMATQLPQLVSK
ncbi:MAG: hypothetical protein M3Z18_09635 [Gemmatimonadota bacterium]|nr:hypothetical protein [Gemmatimonadota bacterium]